jgi:hypothetical protein
MLPRLNQERSTIYFLPSGCLTEIYLSNIAKYSFENLTVTTPEVVSKATSPCALSFAIQVPHSLVNL